MQGLMCELQGLKQLQMVDVTGALPAESDEFLGGLNGLTSLAILNNGTTVKMSAMKCLTALHGLQVIPSDATGCDRICFPSFVSFTSLAATSQRMRFKSLPNLL